MQSWSQTVPPALEAGAEANSIWDQQQQQLGLGRTDTATAHISQRHHVSAKPAHLGHKAISELWPGGTEGPFPEWIGALEEQETEKLHLVFQAL